MQNIKHVVSTKYNKTFRNEKLRGKFDLPEVEHITKQWDINIDIPKAWSIGLVVGASGSGKTTLVRKLIKNYYMHESFEWDSEQSIVDNFSEALTLDQITSTLSHVGFSSPPQWLVPYNNLSNGQKFRVELARCLLEIDKPIVFDEFTSVVDRNVAKASSAAVGKAVRHLNKQFIAVTCHYDVEEWLQPDWVLDVSTGEFRRGSLRRPKINLEIKETERSSWRLFKEHHYLDTNISKIAKCYTAYIDDVPAAFTSIIHFPNPKGGSVRRVHRTVVLPDYQGLGISKYLTNSVCQHWKDKGFKVQTSTSHPAMIASRCKDDNWAMNSKPKMAKRYTGTISPGKHNDNKCRLMASFTFTGNTR